MEEFEIVILSADGTAIVVPTRAGSNLSGTIKHMIDDRQYSMATGAPVDFLQRIVKLMELFDANANPSSRQIDRIIGKTILQNIDKLKEFGDNVNFLDIPVLLQYIKAKILNFPKGKKRRGSTRRAPTRVPQGSQIRDFPEMPQSSQREKRLPAGKTWVDNPMFKFLRPTKQQRKRASTFEVQIPGTPHAIQGKIVGFTFTFQTNYRPILKKRKGKAIGFDINRADKRVNVKPNDQFKLHPQHKSFVFTFKTKTGKASITLRKGGLIQVYVKRTNDENAMDDVWAAIDELDKFFDTFFEHAQINSPTVKLKDYEKYSADYHIKTLHYQESPKPKITKTIHVTAKLPFSVSLREFNENHQRESHYNPEKGPALTYSRNIDAPAVNIVSSGKLNIIAPSMPDIYKELRLIGPKLLEFSVEPLGAQTAPIVQLTPRPAQPQTSDLPTRMVPEDGDIGSQDFLDLVLPVGAQNDQVVRSQPPEWSTFESSEDDIFGMSDQDGGSAQRMLIKSMNEWIDAEKARGNL